MEGSEIRPFKTYKHLKSKPFEDQISDGLVFKALSIVTTIWKPEMDHSKSIKLPH